jgi:hypothetical protein
MFSLLSEWITFFLTLPIYLILIVVSQLGMNTSLTDEEKAVVGKMVVCKSDFFVTSTGKGKFSPKYLIQTCSLYNYLPKSIEEYYTDPKKWSIINSNNDDSYKLYVIGTINKGQVLKVKKIIKKDNFFTSHQDIIVAKKNGEEILLNYDLVTRYPNPNRLPDDTYFEILK